MCYHDLATVKVARAVRLGVQMRSWSRQCEWPLSGCSATWGYAPAGPGRDAAASSLRQCAPGRSPRRSSAAADSASESWRRFRLCHSGVVLPRSCAQVVRQLPVRRALRDAWRIPLPLASLRVAGCTTPVAM